MLKHDFPSSLALHSVPVHRIQAFAESAATPLMRCLKASLDTSNSPQEHLDELNALIDGFGKDVSYFLQLLATRHARRYCHGKLFMGLRRTLRAVFNECHPHRQGEHLSKGDLQGKVWKTTLEEACDISERYWRSAQERAHAVIRNLPVYRRLNAAERYYIGCLLHDTSDMFFDMLDGKAPRPLKVKKMKGRVRNARSLARIVRAQVRIAAGRFPRHGESRSATLTTECYTVRRDKSGRQYISIISSKPRQRIEFPVIGNITVARTIRLVRVDDRFYLHVTAPVKVRPLSNIPAARSSMGEEALYGVALDMGVSEVFVDDTGKRFGKELGPTLKRYAMQMDAELKNRNKIEAVYRKTEDPKKKGRIKKFNLGVRKFKERQNRRRKTIERIVNSAINQVLQERPADVYIIEAFGLGSFSMQGINKKTRRILSGWVRGVIKERMGFKVQAHGSKLISVPASYSSQRCSCCGMVHRKSRNNDDFKCVACKHKAHADANGALNLLLAVHDRRIRKNMGRFEVKAAYREEYLERAKERGETPKDFS